MTTTLVTGGAGFIGRHLVARLTAEGRDVIVLDRRGTGPLAGCAHTIYGDIRDAAGVTDAMAHADSWVHLAGVLGTQETIANPRPAVETNILGGLNVLEAAAQYRLPGVYITVGNHWMNNPYSISKTTVERLAQMYRDERGTPVSVVRAVNAYGPGQVPAAPYGPSKVRKIIPAFVCRALTGDPIEIYGDGQQIMDMIHVQDVADILARVLTRTEALGHGLPTVVEAGTGRHTTVLDIARTVADAAGGAELVHLPMRPGEPVRSVVVADVDTLDGIADPARFVRLENGVAETVDWYRRHWLPAWKASR